jgi:hypothetical protein
MRRLPVFKMTSSPQSRQRNGAFRFDSKYAVTVCPSDLRRAESIVNIHSFYHQFELLKTFLSWIEKYVLKLLHAGKERARVSSEEVLAGVGLS